MKTAIDEKHYSTTEIAERLGVSVDTVRRWFRDRPGVIKLTPRQPGSRRRSRCVLRIPESIFIQVYQQLGR